MTKPTILFIPGSYSPALFYYDVVQGLKQDGYDAVVYDIPSASGAPPLPPAGLTEDAVFFREKLGDLVEKGQDVVVVGHSYGGMVLRETIKGFGKPQRAANGKDGGVVRVIYVAAMLAGQGQSGMEVIADLKFEDTGIQEWPVPVSNGM
jgi:pimeloyl-ACP methyl ester carboxylesterase